MERVEKGFDRLDVAILLAAGYPQPLVKACHARGELRAPGKEFLGFAIVPAVQFRNTRQEIPQ
jgi:hypothetical protein